ncbi:hypothetical protein GONAM_15_01440 [Gordonia namibiensis NBRC 108229]|uniref:Uncharacterized protein n=1 Tax=Gordonia namibiensis NBRC 108229 TaxID=1208314 RepID=K6XNN7_9ACTN|nr:hypothetical protein [Gordonia namibiensis]GAC00435.1 hypothetical protein GONAM_15_01440 [Gordonia namibiensis NBRC 108229]
MPRHALAVRSLIVASTIAALGLGGAPAVADEHPTIPRFSSTPTPAAGPVTDVAPARYAIPGSPAAHHFAYAHNPLRECVFYPVDGRTQVVCSVAFPPGTPSVKADPFSGPPNAIILTSSGTRPTIVEGGPVTAPDLPVDHRITVAGISCRTIAENSVKCAGPGGGFRFLNGTLTTW